MGPDAGWLRLEQDALAYQSLPGLKLSLGTQAPYQLGTDTPCTTFLTLPSARPPRIVPVWAACTMLGLHVCVVAPAWKPTVPAAKVGAVPGTVGRAVGPG